ncbi:MAG: DNA translocase FtsK [Anaerolineae bacterium]|nr:DNA translocase FtsK [Anaerolineae bacterium]
MQRPPAEAIRQTQLIGQRLMERLAEMGFCRPLPDGTVDHIKFSRVFVADDASRAAYEVDVQRVPRGVRLDKVIANATMHDLTIALGRHTDRLNTIGATLAVELDAGLRRPLPTRVLLDLAALPNDKYLIPIGVGRGPVARSLLETSHILVGGESRSGKSTWLNAALVSLLARHTPSDLRLALIDPKGVEFTLYRDLPHLYRPIAVEPAEAIETVEALAAEMHRRQRMFQAALARNLFAYNARAAALGVEGLPLLAVVIDEVTDLALLAGKAFTDPLTRLASKAASFGIVLVLSTQNPKAEVLNTLIKGNLSVRIAFRVAAPEHSRVILGVSGAERLPRTMRGRMMARLDADLVELQGYLVRDEWVATLTNHLRGYRLDPQMGVPTDPPRPALTDLERRLVRYAVEELDGAFVSNKIADTFKTEISARGIKNLAAEWEQKGWLSAPRYQGDARYVTGELAALTGSLDRWSESSAALQMAQTTSQRSR